MSSRNLTSVNNGHKQKKLVSERVKFSQKLIILTYLIQQRKNSIRHHLAKARDTGLDFDIKTNSYGVMASKRFVMDH